MNNAALENLLTRRSCRAFTDEAVSVDLIAQVEQAGLCAPSGRNRQSGIIIEIASDPLRSELAELNRQIGGWDQGFDPFYAAPVILAVLVPSDCPTGVYDGSLMIGNMLLAASALGLGACWIHRCREEFARPEGQKILDTLGIKGAWTGIGHVALGHPKENSAKALPRREGRIFKA